ncbi:MAG: hypothetical protein ACRC7O_11430 [Fimbriiglobus sp.]
MAYGDFTMRSAAAAFGLTERIAPLFQDLEPVPVPGWLTEFLAHTQRQPRVSEKARGELIVMPVLAAAAELAGVAAVYSGVRMDVDANLGLVGECDFLVARTPPLRELRPPVVTVVEAKKADIDLGLGQCVAQIVGAKLWNERDGKPLDTIYGCVTSGDVWQFLRLSGTELTTDTGPYYLTDLGRILGVFRAILDQPSE